MKVQTVHSGLKPLKNAEMSKYPAKTHFRKPNYGISTGKRVLTCNKAPQVFNLHERLLYDAQSITSMETVMLLTRHLHVVITVDAVFSPKHQASVITAVHELHVRYLKFHPAVAPSYGDPPPQRVTGVPRTVQQFVASSWIKLTAGLDVAVVKRREG